MHKTLSLIYTNVVYLLRKLDVSVYAKKDTANEWI